MMDTKETNMSDRDYGCNANDPENIIAVILDNAQSASEIVKELDSLGFVIVSRAMVSATYSHMCRDGHPQIGHRDSSSEMCPLCRAQAALVMISEWGNDKDVYGKDAEEMIHEAKIALRSIA